MKRYLLLLTLLLLNCTAVHQATKFYENGSYPQAIQKCQQILAADSLNAPAYLILGKCYFEQGKIDSAIQALSRSYQIQPEQKTQSALITARLKMADIHSGQKADRSTRDELLAVLALDSTNVPGLLKLGDFYYANGFLDLANVRYQKVLSLEPAHPAAAEKVNSIQIRTAQAEKEYVKGLTNYKKYQYKTAIKQMNQVLKSKPDHKAAQYYLALANGHLLYKKGSKKACWDAIEEFGKGMSLRPESGEPHYFMAMAYEKKDRDEYDNAIDEYKQALEKEPNGWFAKQVRKKIKELIAERDKMRKFWGK